MMIEETLYREIQAQLPIACVDLLLLRRGHHLLLKRVQTPAKGQWWFPGGRILKNESIVDACLRKGREELGLELDVGELVSVEESMFPDEAPGIHTINMVMLVSMKHEDQVIELDHTHAEHRWFDSISPGLHHCVSGPLLKAGFNWEDD